MVIENEKTLENLIDSIKIRLIRLIKNQSNDYIRLNSIDSAANRTSIAFDWLRLVFYKETFWSNVLLALYI